jgi:hypothetical protein
MPSMGRRQTTAVLDDIYSEYAAVATVPLTIDWGNQNKARSVIRHHEKELPPPPAIKIDPGSTSPPVLVGRRGFGIESRSSSPLSREWSDESAGEQDDMPGLVRRSAMKRRSEKVQSTDSTESVWFGMDIYSSPSDSQKSGGSSGEASPSRSGSSRSRFGGSADTWLTTSPRIRIFNHDNTASPTEIHVGQLYEVTSYVWDAMTHADNIKALAIACSPFALPRSSVINLVASSSISLDSFLKRTELHVHLRAPQKPRYTTLDVLEITLPQDLIDALNTTPDTQYLAGVLRIVMIQQIGEYLSNHILLRDGREILITPSIDLARAKEGKGGDQVLESVFGGILNWRWRCDRLQVLLRRRGNVHRIPERMIGEMYRNVKVDKFKIDELGL